MSLISFLFMRNFIYKLSFPISHIVFSLKKCSSDRFEGLFLCLACSRFSERFQRPSESFVKTIKVFFTFPRLSNSIVLQRLSMPSALLISETIRVFCQDYQSLLYFSKTIKVCCLAETINVFCSLHFQRLSKSFTKTNKVFSNFPRLSKSVVL